MERQYKPIHVLADDRKNAAGRRKKYNSSAEFLAQAIKYFEAMDASPMMEEKLAFHKGEPCHAEVTHMRAYTLSGLRVFLGMSPACYADYRNNEDFKEDISYIEDVIRTQKFEGAAANLLNPAIIARDLGLIDKQEVDVKNAIPVEKIERTVITTKERLMSTLQINTPEWGVPFLTPARYKGAHGGRGSGKSHFFAEMLIEDHVRYPHMSSVCIREVQKSIKMSVKRLLEAKIQSLGVGHYFEVQDAIIKSKKGNGIIIFEGMQNHNSDSIKSLEGFDRAYFEEAQNASQRSLDLLRPTIRKEGSELWFVWNPEDPSDPIDKLLRGAEPPPNSVVAEVNYMNNPWFPDVLREEMEYDRKRDLDKFNWIWGGGYKKMSAAAVFKNWKVEEFETDKDKHLRFGADWGFANDPSTLVRGYTEGRTLYIDHEAYEVGCEIDDLPDLFMQVPQSERWPIVADSARPETISYMRRHGFPKIRKAVKGRNSLYEGVEFLKTYDIVVHPRCKHTAQELKDYSYKIDPDTDEVLPLLQDDNNHIIDAARYMLEGARRAEKARITVPTGFTPLPIVNYM